MKDKIFLHGLEARCLIGIFKWERKIKQKVLVDLEFPTDARKAARSDQIRNATDYKRIAKRTLDFVSKSKFYLIETLAEKLASCLLKEFRLKAIRISISKPGAIRGAKNVGVEIFRQRR